MLFSICPLLLLNARDACHKIVQVPLAATAAGCCAWESISTGLHHLIGYHSTSPLTLLGLTVKTARLSLAIAFQERARGGALAGAVVRGGVGSRAPTCNSGLCPCYIRMRSFTAVCMHPYALVWPTSKWQAASVTSSEVEVVGSEKSWPAGSRPD
jgi:hypothetical protein